MYSMSLSTPGRMRATASVIFPLTNLFRSARQMSRWIQRTNAEYRANREIVTSHIAFERMRQDAKQRRSFSNLVTEFTTEFDGITRSKSSEVNIDTKQLKKPSKAGSMSTMG